MRKKSIKIMAAFMLTTTVLLSTACGSGNDPVRVKISDVTTGQIEAIYTITGVLVPAQAADISAPFLGKVSAVHVEEGDTVREGQVLVQLDDSQLEAQLGQAEAAYTGSKNTEKQAEINLENAKETLDRTKALYAEGAVAKVQLDADQKAYDLAKIQYESSISSGLSAAKASVDSIQTQVQNSAIKSPIAGVVVSKNINAGETATVGTPLITVADLSSLKLKGTVLQTALPYIKKEDPVEISIDIYPDRTFAGRISEIGSMSVSTGTYFPIEISMENTDQLASGISAHADVHVTGAKHLIVPASAIVENNGENYLFTVENGIAKKITVMTGLKNDSEIEILKGLKGNEVIVASNANHLIDGMPVQSIKE